MDRLSATAGKRDLNNRVLLQSQFDDLWVRTDGCRRKLQDTPANLERLHKEVYPVMLVLVD